MISRKKGYNKHNNKSVKSSRNINRQIEGSPHILKKKAKHHLVSRDKSSANKVKIKKIDSKVGVFFGNSNLNEIATKTKFLIRKSRITPFIFIYALSMLLYGSSMSLDMLAIQINTIFGANITGQALCLRMGQAKSVKFLKSSFEFLLKLQLEFSFSNEFSAAFSMFKEVRLEDSTTLSLHKHARKDFKGVGGSASKSSLKLNWVFNLCRHAAVAVNLCSGSIPDQTNAKKSMKHLKKGMLIIRDLGYFTIEALNIIIVKKAYYLSRLRQDYLIYLNENDPNSINKETFLKKATLGGKSAQIPIFIGKKDRFATTLILQRVPRWVFNQRIKQYKIKQAKNPSAEFVTWAKYSIYITNIPKELLTSNLSDCTTSGIEKIIIEIYKIRWQIELLFKRFKSVIKIHVINEKNKNRILCMIYGKLIAIMLSLMVLSYASSHSYKGREISLWKVTIWLIEGQRLAKAIFKGAFGSLYFDFSKQFKLLCKNKRKRKTSLERIEELMPWKREAA